MHIMPCKIINKCKDFDATNLNLHIGKEYISIRHIPNGIIISSYLLFARFYFKILFYIKFEINSKKNRKGSGKQNQRYQINRI